ncbi:restriction endonuclease subunit S [Rhodococcoides yunnanense]|uniref:restriction endonuclease subunit S n=1 Tax=Rhodococcoides yunnanense TaxID=278209 RepID=UPI0009341029|nr:restriction endonuclease subunit S [Rhodococcus yunnanensis]
MRTGYIDYKGARRISAATFEQWTRRLRPEYGDLLLAREAPVGPIIQIPMSENIAPGQRTVLLRPDRGQITSTYLYYLLRSPDQQTRLLQKSGGSTVAHLNVADVRGFGLPTIPDLATQERICSVLRAIDQKIACNSEIIANSDMLSALAFRSMSELSQHRPLSSMAEFINGKAFTRNASGTGRVVVRIAELNSGIGPSTIMSDALVPPQHLATKGDILFAWSGSLTLHRWYRDDAIINQHIFKVLPIGDTPNWLIFQLINNKLRQFQDIAADKATTMGHIQRKHLDDPVPVPRSTDIDRWDPLLSALWSRSLLAEVESEHLSKLRDLLLPQLVAGRLTVGNAEEHVGDLPTNVRKTGA